MEAINVSTSSTVPAQAVLEIHGKPAEAWDATVVQLGFDTCKAYSAQEAAQRSIAQCDGALFDLVKGLSYAQFQYIRQQFIVGGVDAGKTANAAEQVWDKQINRIVTQFQFVRPKSVAKDAQRKAEAKAKQIAQFEAQTDGELQEKRDALVSQGSVKAMREATAIAKELERRHQPMVDKAQAERKAVYELLVARAKDLYKAGTADADDLLIRALNLIS